MQLEGEASARMETARVVRLISRTKFGMHGVILTNARLLAAVETKAGCGGPSMVDFGSDGSITLTLALVPPTRSKIITKPSAGSATRSLEESGVREPPWRIAPGVTADDCKGCRKACVAGPNTATALLKPVR